MTPCRSCSVPTDAGDTCGFCATYRPPEPTPVERIDKAIMSVDELRRDINAVVRDLPADAPLIAVADVVAALGHLREAAVVLDKAADTLKGTVMQR